MLNVGDEFHHKLSEQNIHDMVSGLTSQNCVQIVPARQRKTKVEIIKEDLAMGRYILLITVFLVSLTLLTACSGGGPQFPFDSNYQDGSDLGQEFEEGRREAEELDRERKNDPCLDDKLSGVPPELQRCGNWHVIS